MYYIDEFINHESNDYHEESYKHCRNHISTVKIMQMYEGMH